MKYSCAVMFLTVLVGGFAPLGFAQEKSVNPGINRSFESPDAQKFVERFERDGREVYDNRTKVLDACAIKPGMAIADVGAGTGLFTRLFARKVGGKGRVFAVDIADTFVDHIEKTCAEAGLKNVVASKCKPDDVGLPPNSVDMVFICDTYHHFEFPQKTMRSISKALRPEGRVVLIDFHRVKGKSSDWIMNHVRAGQETFTKEILESGFRQQEEKSGLLKDNYFLVFKKAPIEKEPASKSKAEDQSKSSEEASGLNAQQIARLARSSLVSITTEGRDGRKQGIGTGFVVSEDGLVATNLHVIGRGRTFAVELSSGKTLPVESIHASDRVLDLAVLKVNVGKEKLQALKLGDSSRLSAGAPVVIMGNPHGLKYSVVSGVVSGSRVIDGRKMFQLAVPIEPGNSGGPVLDRLGRVQGVVTMKSVVTDNLGFAVTINQLKPLLEKPNSVPIERWLTIGQVDRVAWQTMFGARWQQRGGHILVDGAGAGFGGRALCLRKVLPPQLPFELAAYVRLDNERGAAGLVFHADGMDRHYGFYPSNGKLRLTCFEGPNVFTWRVLHDRISSAYRHGEWNHLKVRIEKDKLRCYVNDELVFESEDVVFSAGRVGLAKFRETAASFKQFEVAKTIAPVTAPTDVVRRIDEQLESLPPLEQIDDVRVARLAEQSDWSVRRLESRAADLERRAKELRRTANDVHVAGVVAELREIAAKEEAELDLLTATLLLAKLDERELDVSAYVGQIERMATEIRQGLAKKASEDEKLAALKKYLFDENGFHGNRFDYYHRANSYLNRTIDDRTGLPISLSVLFMELGQRLGLRVEGVGLPGHFVVRHVKQGGDSQLIDVFDGGKTMTPEEADKVIADYTPQNEDKRFLRAVSKRDILVRMLGNLQSTAQRNKDQEALLRYLTAALSIDPDDTQSRGIRAVVRFQTGRRDVALADLDWFLQEQPPGIDLPRIREMREYFLKGRPK